MKPSSPIKTPYFQSDIDEVLKNEIGGKMVQKLKEVVREYPDYEIIAQVNIMARKKQKNEGN